MKHVGYISCTGMLRRIRNKEGNWRFKSIAINMALSVGYRSKSESSSSLKKKVFIITVAILLMVWLN